MANNFALVRPFAVAGFSMLLVLALLFFLPEWAAYIVLALAATGLIIALFLRKREKRIADTFACACGAIVLAGTMLLLQLWGSYYPALRLEGDNLQIRAVVTSLPEARYGRYYYQTRLISINGASVEHGVKVRFTGKVPLYVDPYDEIEYTGTIFALGSEDPEIAERYRAEGFYLGSYAVGHSEDPVEIIYTNSHNPMKAILRLRERILRNLRENYRAEESALLRGMLLGDTSGLTFNTNEDFRAAGISHLFSVSGVHMSLLAWSVYKALQALRIPRVPAACLCGAFVLLFMALTGFSASCVRAGIMMLVVLAGECASRQPDSLNSMGLAAAILMMLSPLSAGQVGLQLSFAATLGIVLFQERLCAPVKQRCKDLPPGLRSGINGLWSSLCLSFAAMALNLPIALLRLPGKVLWIAPIANLLLVPLGGAVMILGGLYATTHLTFLRVLSEPLASLLLWGTAKLGRLKVPGFAGGQQVAAVAFACAAILCAAALFLRYLGKPVRLRVTASAMCALTFIACWLPGFLRRDDARLQVLDTGAGMSILLTKGEYAALFACGGDELPAGAAEQALSALGIRGLDLLLIPREHELYASGAPQLLKDLPVGKALSAQPSAAAATLAGQYAQATAQFSALPLWEGAGSIFYMDEYYTGEGVTACLLEIGQARIVILFAAPRQMTDIPYDWRNADEIITLQTPPSEFRITPQGVIYR